VRQLAAAFENSLIGMFFKRSLKSGSEQPHISERLRLQKNYAALGETAALPGMAWKRKLCAICRLSGLRTEEPER